MLLLLLLACAPCPRFEEMTVSDRDGVASATMLADIDQAISDFADATGRDGVCIAEVRAQENVRVAFNDAAVGKCSAERRAISVEADTTFTTREIVTDAPFGFLGLPPGQ